MEMPASTHVPRSSFRLHRHEQRVAQLVAHVFRVHGVEGSSPSTLTECADSLNAQVAERQLRRPVEPSAHEACGGSSPSLRTSE